MSLLLWGWCCLESIGKANSSTFSSSVDVLDELDGSRAGVIGSVRLVAFFTLLIVTFAGTQLLIDTGLPPIPTSTFGVFNRIVDGSINATILVTGSSRAVNHYDPRELTRETGTTAWN